MGLIRAAALLLIPVWSLAAASAADRSGPFVQAQAQEPATAGQLPPVQAAEAERHALTLRALQLYQAGKYDDALPLAERALTLTEQLYPADDPMVAASLKLVVLVLAALKRPAEAEPLMRRALAIDEKASGPDALVVALDLKTLVGLLEDLDRSEEAEPLLRRALQIDEARLPPDDPTIQGDRVHLQVLVHLNQERKQGAGNRILRALTGQLSTVLLKAVPLAFVVSLLLLWIYLRSVKRSMLVRAGASPETPPTGTESALAAPPALPLELVTEGEVAERSLPQRSASRALTGPWQAALVYGVAGLGYAATLTALYLYAGGQEFVPLRFLFIALVQAWPVVLTVGLVAARSWRDWLLAVAAYFALFAAVAGAGVAHSANFTWLQAIVFWVLAVLPGTFLILAFLPRPIRAVGPMVLVFMMAAVGGTTIWRNVLGPVGNPFSRRVIDVFVSLGLDGVQAFYAMQAVGGLVLGLIGWLVLLGIGRLYRFRWISDQSIIIDSLWFLFALASAIDFAFFRPSWFLAPLVAFAVYKIIALLGFSLLRGRMTSSAADPKLLLLRVFSLGRRSARLFDAFAKEWLYAGSIRLIAGPDLATSTVEPHEFLDFLSGRLARRFISGPVMLDQRLAESEPRRDFDLRYRVSDFFCRDDTWKMVLARLARVSDAVLMDLRGFSPGNQGCIFEINELLNTVPLDHIVFVVDGTTDDAFLREMFAQGWAMLRADSPNREITGPRVHLFPFTGTGGGSVPNLVRVVAGAAGR